MPMKSWIWVLVAPLLIIAPASSAPPNTTEITSLVYTPDGKTLISSGFDGSLRFWDIPQGKERAKIQAHKNGIYAIALSPDGKFIASAGGDRLVRLWDLDKAREIRTAEGHLKEVVAVAFSPDGKTLASGSYDKTIRIWEAATGKELHVLRRHENWVTSLAFSPDGKGLASGGIVPFETNFFKGNTQGDKVRIWDYVAGKQLEQLPIKGSRVAFSPDGKYLASGGMYIDLDPTGKGNLRVGKDSFDSGSRITLWDMKEHKEHIRISEYWTGIAFSRDGKYLATYWGGRPHPGGMLLGHENKSVGIHLWDPASGKEILHFTTPKQEADKKDVNPLLRLQEGPTALAISPNGAQLASGNGEGKIEFWDLTPEQLKEINRP